MSGPATAACASLLALAARWGGDPQLVQGPGGNVSVKDGPDLVIKASGYRFGELSATAGLTRVDLAGLRRTLADPAAWGGPDAEARYAALLAAARRDPEAPRPSLEAGFHALLPERFVLHTHSLCGLLAATLPPATPAVADLLTATAQSGVTLHAVAAALPGLRLTEAVRRGLAAARPPSGTPALWLLRNHGVIWTGDELAAVVAAAEAFETRGRAALRLAARPLPTVSGADTDAPLVDFSAWSDFTWSDAALFPDFAVFFAAPERRPRVVGARVTLAPGPPSAVRDASELVFAEAALASAAAPIAALPAWPATFAEQVAALPTEALRVSERARRQATPAALRAEPPR